MAESEKDWCADGRKMVEDGSDGVWCRCGPDPNTTRLGRWFGIRCNPFVTCFATVLLFGWVLLCMVALPSTFCLEVGSVNLNVTRNSAVFTPTNDSVGVFQETNQTAGVLGVDGQFTFPVTRSVVIEKVCYMPQIEFKYWMAWVSYTFTWLYIVTQDIWIIFMFVVALSKYGKLKLGKDNDVPEFGDLEWFAMIFCCGIATGLFYFSVGEPINHYEPCGKWAFSGPDENGKLACKGTAGWANRYSHLTDNFRAQEAINQTLYHFGLAGWVCYALIGVLIGLLHYRKGLPMTLKTCFYPLIGTRVYGFWGDLVDGVSIVCTTFGVCTSLAMGVRQINEGIHVLNGYQNWFVGQPGFFGTENQGEWFSKNEEYLKQVYDVQTDVWRRDNLWGVSTAASIMQYVTRINEQIALIWIITVVSTLSIMTGLDKGVKWLSVIAFFLGLFLLFTILVMDDTFFILNLFIQAIGRYLQTLVELGFHTGAFDGLNDGAPDGRQEYGPPSGAGWMNDWTIFYWGWWISWAPFVGVILARISKGRTVREFILTAMCITVFYNFFWLTVWGGAGLKMEMAAEHAGITCDEGGPLKYRRNFCRPDNTAINSLGWNRYTNEPTYFCSTVTRLSCHYFDYPPMMFDVVMQYHSLGPFLSFLIIVALFLYFITSSDSGSLVDTIMAANGIAEPCIVQRIWWSLTEGFCATGLMWASTYMIDDKRGVMKALQAASIAAGLPYTILICFMCLALWKTLKLEFGEQTFLSGFRSTCLDFGITLYGGAVGKEKTLGVSGPKLNFSKMCAVVTNLVFPFRALNNATRKLKIAEGKKFGWLTRLATIFAGVVLFHGGWLLVFCDSVPIPDGFFTYSQYNGTINLIQQETSTRYGVFRKYSNDWKAGEIVKTNPHFASTRMEDMGLGNSIYNHNQLLVFGFFFFFGFVGVVASLRTAVRAHFKICGGPITDFLAATFLWPTVLIQINEVLDEGRMKPLPAESGDTNADKMYGI